jgi:hypothetical protein
MSAINAKTLLTGPLNFSYPITALVSINTSVTGDSRQYASVSIVYGSLTLWSQTLTQLGHTATIPFEILAGDITIEKGGTFVLAIPTSLQNGSVTANLMIKSGPQPAVPFKGPVASWPLSS